MRPPLLSPKAPKKGLLWDFLTFDKLMTAQLAYLVYWAGLGVICLLGFAALGASVVLALRGEGEALLAIPAIVLCILVLGVLVLLWRGLCEFYIAVFRIAEDLRVLRRAAERRDGIKVDTSFSL